MAVLKHQLRKAAKLGMAMHLLRECRDRYGLSLASVFAWLHVPIELQQFELFYDDQGRPVAYATWAFLADDILQQYLMDEVDVLPPAQWNEGLNLCVTDVVAPYGDARRVIRFFEDWARRENRSIFGLKPAKNNMPARALTLKGIDS